MQNSTLICLLSAICSSLTQSIKIAQIVYMAGIHLEYTILVPYFKKTRPQTIKYSTLVPIFFPTPQWFNNSTIEYSRNSSSKSVLG